MQTIKTAVVVVLLLGVCYGAYVALNAPDAELPPGLEAWSEENGDLGLQIEDGTSVAIDIPQLSGGSSGVPADTKNLLPPDLPPLGLGGGATPSPSTLGSTTNSTSKETLGLPPSLGTPNSSPPALTLPTIEPLGSKAGAVANNKTDASKTPAIDPALALPDELEGKSIPLPGAPASSDLSNKLANDTSSITLPGAPALPSSGNDLGQNKSESGLDTKSTPAAPISMVTSPSLNASSNSADKASSTKPTVPFKTAKEEALKLAADGKLRDALAKLTVYYNHIELTQDERMDLIEMLDALAREVIYSKRHLLEPPFIVNSGETLESIANRYRISPETLASINLMGDSRVVLASTQMKVLKGPFRAEVNLTRGELTMFLNDLYAGRFAISVGKEPTPTEGTYQVVDRRRDRTYYGASSQVIPASDPRNPYGGFWMSLGQDLCIHGSSSVTAPELANAGCISLAPLDAKEVYSLLGQGSEVKIHR